MLTDPPLLEGEVEIDLSDCYERESDPFATVRGGADGADAFLRIERLIAERKLAIAANKAKDKP